MSFFKRLFGREKTDPGGFDDDLPGNDVSRARFKAYEELARQIRRDFVVVREVAYPKGKDGAWGGWKFAQRHPDHVDYRDTSYARQVNEDGLVFVSPDGAEHLAPNKITERGL